MQVGQTNLFNTDEKDQSVQQSHGIPLSIYQAVIRSLSFEGNCIIDATTETGMFIISTMHKDMSCTFIAGLTTVLLSAHHTTCVKHVHLK